MRSLRTLEWHSPKSKQGGVVLFIALIALVVMTLAGIALVRSVDTGNVIAGNFAFKQSTVQAGDVGVELAFTALQGIVGSSLDTNIAGKYFATLQPAYADPKTIAWGTVPCRDKAGTTISCTDQSLYRIQYIIDRLCTGTLPITDKQKQCYSDYDPAASEGGSKKSGAVSFAGTKDTLVYYRVSIRIQGPRETVSFVQAIFAA